LNLRTEIMQNLWNILKKLCMVVQGFPLVSD